MNKPTRIKILAFLLALVMALTLVPSSAVAASEDNSTRSESTTQPETTATDSLLEAAATEKPTTAELTANCEILNYVDLEVFEANNHVLRLKSEETSDTYVFLNENGTKTVYYLDDDVKFVDANGITQEKNLTLTSSVGGYATTKNNVGLSIPTNPTSGITINWNGKTVRLIPQGGTLGRTVMENNTVRYPDYYGEGTTLVYTPTLTGVKEDIVLDSYTGQNEFVFMLNTGGLNLYSAAGRYYLAASKTATDRIDLGDVVSFDARGQFSVGTMTAQTITAGQIYRLTLTVDEAFLTDPNTTYPVHIDPTLEVRTETNSSGIEDATIYQGKPTLNAGAWMYNHCGYYNDDYKVARTLYRLPGLTDNEIYQTVTPYKILSAYFYVRETTGTAPVNVHLYTNRGSATWQETGVTWNNAGVLLGGRQSTVSMGYSQYASFNITELLRGWKLGSNQEDAGFILISSNETSVDKALCAAEYSTANQRPYVVVTYGFNPYYSTYEDADYYRGTHLYDFFVQGNPNPIGMYADDSLQLRANCYGYAFRYFYAPVSFPTPYKVLLSNGDYYQGYWQQPGEFADKTNGLDIYSASNPNNTIATIDNRTELDAFYSNVIWGTGVTNADRMNYLVQLLQADAQTLGYTITEYTGTTIPSAQGMNDRRLIAVTISGIDYHFYMQHSDNTWSHKPSIQQPTNVCIGCNLALTNSNIRDHACEGFYAGGELKFFYITKDAVADYGHGIGTAENTVKTNPRAGDLAGNCFVGSKDLGTVPIAYSVARIDYIDDLDYYAFRTGTTGTYTLSTSASTGIPLQVKIYDHNGNSLYTYTTNNGTLNISLQLASNSMFFIVFSSPNQTTHTHTASYQFQISAS